MGHVLEIACPVSYFLLHFTFSPESQALPLQSPAVSRSRHLTVCDGVSVRASAIVQDIRCFGYRNLTLETSSLSSQSSAVASPGPAKWCEHINHRMICYAVSCCGKAHLSKNSARVNLDESVVRLECCHQTVRSQNTALSTMAHEAEPARTTVGQARGRQRGSLSQSLEDHWN